MVGRGRDQHQPEPWAADGRSIVNASGWILGKTIFEADARRIVAAINDVLAIPTAALEAGFIREILVPRPETPGEMRIRIHPVPVFSDPAEFFIHDRRVTERRQGDRRQGERRRGVAANPRIFSIAD
jgi:hypothetical protein